MIRIHQGPHRGDLIDYFDAWQINYGKIYGVMDAPWPGETAGVGWGFLDTEKWEKSDEIYRHTIYLVVD